jgi:hypothetical protein
MILNRARAISTTETPSVSKEDMAPSSSRTIPASETTKQLPFKILDLSNGGVFENLNSFNSTFRTTKLFCLMVYTQLG